MSNPAIIQYSHGQLHSFLDELKNGTRNYRTVSSLGQQVAQEYRGRSVIELLQNAHDALGGAPVGDPRQITFVLRTEPSPTLLIANSGVAFRPVDFRGICQLGQSPKDPNKSVGNKGLGFRSVLELSTCPEIWSSSTGADAPAFRFGFSPKVLETIGQSIAELQSRGLAARSPFIPAASLVDWSRETLEQFLALPNRLDGELTAEVRGYLSPYQFPLELTNVPEEVRALLDTGHCSVVRLPINGGRNGNTAEAVNSVLEQFAEVNSASMIFLAHVQRLVMDVNGLRRTFSRVPLGEFKFDAGTCYQRVEVREERNDGQDGSRRSYHLWEHSIGGDGNDAVRDEIAAAVQHLPNRWPEVRSATLGIAVEDRESSAEGKFVIFLPTTVNTGTSAFLNAPFFGSLDRRVINFDDKYNKLLWQHLLQLHVRIVKELSLRLEDTQRARVIVDLIGSTAVVSGRTKRVLDDVLEAASTLQDPLGEESLVLCDRGWTPPAEAREMFAVASDSKIPRVIWRTHAAFAVLAEALHGRQQSVKALCVACGGSLDPKDAEWSATLESLSAAVQSQSVVHDWAQFLESAVAVLPDRLREPPKTGAVDALRGTRFLPAQSGQRLAASDETALFFQPKRGDDDSIGDVPASLQDRVAFLDSTIATQEGPQGRNTAVHRFLDGRFAREFRREDILRRVVEPAIPQLPVAHGSAEAALCHDLLSWSIKIIGNEPVQSVLATLPKLPVPCHGGWYPMSGATFGPGWDGKQGDAVKTLADGLPANDGQQLLSAVLLSPDHDELTKALLQRKDLLAAGGVVSGLRLRLAKDLLFQMQGYGRHELPGTAPDGFRLDSWDAWRKAVRTEATPRYENWFEYRLQRIYVLPVLMHVGSLSPPAARALSELISASFSHWPKNWPTVLLEKMEGNAWSRELASPLRYALRSLGWFVDHGLSRPLSQRWYVRESLLGTQRERFSHLSPLSLKMVQRLATQPPLLEELRRLGLRTYPLDQDQIGPHLLDALVTAWDRDRIPLARIDIFLSQVRDGWKHLKVELGFPDKFVVTAGRRVVRTCLPAELSDVYLPDNADRVRTLLEHGKPILEMWGEDARRLGSALCAATPLRRASRLREVAVIDGVTWDAQRADGIPLTESRYAWVAPVVLAIAAYGGATATGASTKAWGESANRLRRARVVECERISLDLRDEVSVVASSEPRALWMSGETLAVCRGAETDYSCLAEALQTAVDRLDLIRTLRLVLRELSGALPPANDRIERALAFAEIDAPSLADIRHRWSGSISTLVDRIRPVLAVVGVTEDDLENAQKDEDQLGEWLSARITSWPAADLLHAARRSRDDMAMGRRAYEALGISAELPQWNAALVSLGERYAEVRNVEFVEQAKAHSEMMSGAIQAFARWIAKAEGTPELFLALEQARCNVSFPTSWSETWWQVPFAAVSNLVAEAFVAGGVNEAQIGSLKTATNEADLRRLLEEEGVVVGFAPFQVAAENAKRRRAAVTVVHDVYAVWRQVRGLAAVATPTDLDKTLPSSAYLDEWDASATLQHALATLKDTEFLAACVGCTTAEELRKHLGLTTEDVAKRTAQRQADLAEAARQKRTFNVAGADFELGKDDYSALFDRLSAGSALGSGAGAPTSFTPLAPPGAAGPTGGGGGGGWNPGKSSHLRPSADAKEIGGVVGEMVAFRYLQARFGESVVTRDAWVSEIRLKVLPLVPGEIDQTSDGHGFDCRFRVGTKEWHVEVKATMGDDEEFELSLREIEAASRLAGNKSKIWCILRIRQAFSAAPQFDWLPNPFETENRPFFRMDKTGTRVSYVRKRDDV